MQILDLIQRFSRNIFSILANPLNLDPYLQIIDDATFSYAKFLMDNTLRQESAREFTKKKAMYQ